MKKNSAFMIILSLLLLTSCGAAVSSEITPEETAPSFDTAGVMSAEPDITDGLEGFDFGGKPVSIVYSKDQLGPNWPYDAEEMNGDLLNDTVWERNLKVEERFNVDISFNNVGGTGNEVPSALSKSVLSGDGSYLFGISHTFNSVPSLISNGMLTDFCKIPYVDLSNPWWNSSIRDNLVIGNVLPIAVSSLIYSYADVIYVNQKMISEYDLENPYDLTYNNTWTWVKLAEMASVVSSDINGDGIFTADDQFGYTTPGETVSLMSRLIHSNGMLFATPDENGYPRLITISDRLQNAMERYYSLLFEGDKTYIGTKTDSPGSVDAFSKGRILFMHQTTLQLPALRNTDVEFGIVPLPKYDEAQEKYMSMLSSQLLLVPTADDETTALAGVMLESMAFESWKNVVPAVYDEIFNQKYLRDATSYEMYQKIMDSLVCDFNWNYGNGNKITYIVSELVYGKKSTDVASYLAQNSPAVEKAFEKLYEDVINVYGDQ